MSSTSNIDRFRSEQEKKNPSYDEQKRAIETQIKKIEGQMNSPAPRSIDTTELQRQRDALVKNLYQLDKQNLRPSAPTPTVDERINNDFEAFKKQSQRGRDAVATGVLDLAKSGIEAVRWKAADYSRDLQKKVPFSSFDYKIKEWSDVVDKSLAGASGVIEAKQEKLFPKDAKFGDHLARGAGSMIAFYVPGLGIARGATMLSTVSPRAAMLVGGAASTFLEAASEAGSVYEQNKKRGLPDELASEKASNAFWWNSALVGLTNVLGPLSPEARNMARRAFMSAGTEGVQEFGQQIISNINTGRPWDEGVYESAAIGAILGGGAGAMITPVQSKDAPLKSNATRFQSFESSNQTKLLAEFYGITPDTLLTEVQSIGTDAELQNLETTLAQKYGKDQTAFMDFVDTKLGDNATPADYNAMENARIDAEKFEAPTKFQSEAMGNKRFIDAVEAEQIFRKYFSEEEVPIEIVDRIVTPEGERALGKYKDGIVSFVKNPHQTTPEHEAVHAYLDLFTGAQERSNILNQIIRDTDAVNEIDAEERLADGFVEYVRNRNVQGLSARVIQYISSAWSRIKSFFGNPDRVNRLYRDIATKKRNSLIEPNTVTERDIWLVQNELYQTPESLTLKFLKGIDKEYVGHQEIQDLLKRQDVKKAEREIMERVLQNFDQPKISVDALRRAVAQELLPLRSTVPSEVGSEERYESITLPMEERGNVKNYEETVYQSPIKNSAGRVHFDASYPSYFAHTRVEDMADGSTRRIIEVQSDLFQRGRLDSEIDNIPEANFFGGVENMRRVMSENPNLAAEESERISAVEQAVAKKEAELYQLSQYKQTWWQRIIKEEIRRAALDGKSVVQFPTGETAMKVEGLVNREDKWVTLNNEVIDGSNIKEGDIITYQTHEGVPHEDRRFLVTKSNGDGTFNAVDSLTAENDYGLYQLLKQKDLLDDGRMPDLEELQPHIDDTIMNYLSRLSEGLSAKVTVDTNNPIYKFYESDVQSFLNKYRKGNAELVTDAQGVTWVQTQVTPEDQGPVEAYQLDIFSQQEKLPTEKKDEPEDTSEKFQSLSSLPDSEDLRPFTEDLKEKTNLLRDAVDFAESQIKDSQPASDDADLLINLAEDIRSVLRQSPKLPGGNTRSSFYRDLASVDTVPEITKRLRNLAEKTRSVTVRRGLERISETMRATGKYDDVADFKPFQDAIVEGRPKVQDTSKLDIVERAENVMREVGDFNIDENTKMSDLLDEIYLLESQVNERTKSQYSAKKKSAKQSALKLGKGARPISGQSQRIERETTVSGRDLLKAIETVSKGKAQEYKVRLREAVGQAKEAQRTKDREAYSLANMRRESIKEDLIKEIQRLVPLNRRGRFLKAVKNTKTRGQLKKALERVDAEVERQKRNDLMSRIKNIANSPLSSVDVAYRNDIERILAGIDLSKPTKATLKKLRSRMDYIERTGGFSIPQNLREEVSRLAKDPLSDIETDALQRILDALETLISQGKVSRAMKVSQMQREKERAIERLLTTTVNIDPIVNKMKEGYNYTSKQLRESVRKSRGLWRALNFFTQTDTMDGGMNFQGSNTELAKQMYDAEQQAITATRERMGTVILRIANEVGNQPKLFTEQSQAEMMAAIAYDQGLESQMEAAGWGTSRPDLTEGQEKIINILREEVGDGSYQGEKRFPLMAAVNAMINNEYTAKVPNYFKISYVDSVLTEDEDAMFKSRFGTAKMNAAASLSAMEGMMKSRTPGVARPLRTDMVNLAFEAIAQQEWIINVEPTLRNIYSVVNSKEYTQAGGIKAKETWNRRIQNVAMAWRKEAIQFREEAVFNATSNLGLAYMAFKASTAAIQFSQVAVGTSYVLGKYGPATAVKFFWMSSLNIFKPSTVRDAAAESPVVRFRESGDPLTSIIMRQTGVLDQSKWAKEVQVFEDAMQDAMNDRMAVIRTFLKWRRKAGRVGMDIVKFTDVRATAAQFEAFQELFEDLGATEEEARGDAEILTMVINNDASATFRPEIFEDVSSIRDPEAKFLKRQLLLFQSFNINTLAMTWHNLMKNAMKPTVMPDGTKVRGGLHSGFYALLGLAFLAAGNYGADEMRSVINQYIQGKKYEDDPSIVAAIIMSNLRQIPIAGDLFQIIRNGMIGKYMGSRQIGSPALALALREAEAIGSFLKKPSVKKFVKAAEAVPTSLGVPGTGQAFDLLERLTPTKKKVSTAF